jgi:hypothetical protein
LAEYHSALVCAPPPSPPAPIDKAWNAQRERNVGVGRAEAQIGAQAQMAVNGAQGFEAAANRREAAGGTVADFGDGEGQQRLGAQHRFACGIRAMLDGVFDGAMQGDFKAQQLVGLVERKSMEACALSGMEFTLVPPWMVPRLRVVRGSSGSSV